jgi:hypothetical protein
MAQLCGTTRHWHYLTAIDRTKTPKGRDFWGSGPAERSSSILTNPVGFTHIGCMGHAQSDSDLLHDIYIDESSQTQNRYLLLGGLIVPHRYLDAFEERLQKARLPELPRGEMKWGKISSSKIAAYKRIVDAMMIMPPGPMSSIEFHSLVVDTTKLKDGVYNAGSRETGFNKEVYQLVRKFGRLNRSGIFHVYLDARSTKSSTADLKTILNHGIRLLHPGRDWPFRRVHFRDSSECVPLQVVDILLGAIGFRLNDHRSKVGASSAKCALSDRVLSLGNVHDVTRSTWAEGRFTIWHRQLR